MAEERTMASDGDGAPAEAVVHVALPSSKPQLYADGREHMTYEVVSTLASGKAWTVQRRFQEFWDFHAQVESALGAEKVADAGLTLPPKQMLGNTIAGLLASREGKDFVDDRRIALQAYLQGVLQQGTGTSSYLRNFLQPPLRADWPGRFGDIELAQHDLAHASSQTEWWYFNAHVTTTEGRELSLFCCFFRIATGKDSHAHALNWAIVDPAGEAEDADPRYLQCSLLDQTAPSILRKTLNKDNDHRAIKDWRLRKALLEVLDKDEVPLPDRMFTRAPSVGTGLLDGRKLALDFECATLSKTATGAYALKADTPAIGQGTGAQAACGFELIFTPQKKAVRHGDHGVVAGHDGDDMFYYFIPRCDVTGSVSIGDDKFAVQKGQGWYDHEFGGKQEFEAGDEEKEGGEEGGGEGQAEGAAGGEGEGGAAKASGGGAAAPPAAPDAGAEAAATKAAAAGSKDGEGRGKMEYAWNWAAVQLDDETEVSVATLIDPRDGHVMQTSAVVIGKDGQYDHYEEMSFEPVAKAEAEAAASDGGEATPEWCSVRTFTTFPTHWTLRVPAAKLELKLEAAFDDQEFMTAIARPSFWEGRCAVVGTSAGEPVTGLAFVERNGFNTLSSLNNFFKQVGIRVRESVEHCYPSKPSYEQARDLIASEDTDHYMEGIPLDKFVDTVIAPVRLIADRGGKSWRSYGALACCDVVGGDSREFVDWLALPEFMHVGSLIVDDIQDESETRRGGPCAHLVHGMPLALNAGTAAYFQATSLIEMPRSMTGEKRLRVRNEVYKLYFAALRGGHAGQALDIYGLDYLMDECVPSGNGKLLEQRMLAIHRLKTAVPAGTLARMGALVGGGSPEQVEAVGRYYEAVGVAFQIMDDVLNLRGLYTNPADKKPDKLMKTLGEDIIDGKITMPVCKMSLADRQKLWDTIKSKPKDQEVVNACIADLERVGAIEECVEQSKELVEDAWAELDPFIPSSFAKVMLRSFGWFVTERAH
eukprot:g6722.t1